MSAQPIRSHGVTVLTHTGRKIQIDIAADYDEGRWAWTARFGGLPDEYGVPSTISAPDPYRCIGEATAWLVAKSEGRELPPAPVPSFTIRPVEGGQ